jgi:hypothetical protein
MQPIQSFYQLNSNTFSRNKTTLDHLPYDGLYGTFSVSHQNQFGADMKNKAEVFTW